MSNKIERPAPPALPLAPTTYGVPYENQKTNALRLFFNRITGVLGSLLSTDQGGRFLYLPHGLFYDTTRQQASAINTANFVSYDTTYISAAVKVVDATKIQVDNAGVYNFQFSAQVDKHSANVKSLWLWIRKNGVDITPSARQYGVDEPVQIAWSFNIDMVVGDYIEMVWSVDDTDIDIHGYPTDGVHPGIPSAVMAVSFVSNV